MFYETENGDLYFIEDNKEFTHWLSGMYKIEGANAVPVVNIEHKVNKGEK